MEMTELFVTWLNSLLPRALVVTSVIIAVELVFEHFVQPLLVRYSVERVWWPYLSGVMTAAITAATCVNVFMELIPNAAVGYVLTALVGGIGVNGYHKLLQRVLDNRMALQDKLEGNSG